MNDVNRFELEEILHEFAAEPSHDVATLERYLRAHPEYAESIVDMSLELRLREAATVASAPADEAWLDSAWDSFQSTMAMAAALAPVSDPFAAASAKPLREVRAGLGVPSGVVEGFRTRIVDVATVPDRFLRALAWELNATLDGLRGFLGGAPRLSEGMSFKADDAPRPAATKISFEQLLIDARVPEEDRVRLLADGD